MSDTQVRQLIDFQGSRKMVKKIKKKQSYKNIKSLVYYTNKLVHELVHKSGSQLFYPPFFD
jgi:hypothetical protein